MQQRLNEKVAVVTGAASGIGLATVEAFIREGAKVVAADIQDEKGRLLEQRFGDRIRYTRCDVLDESAIAAALALAVAEFGGLDILFNNAGDAGSESAIEDIDAAAWDRIFGLLVRAPALGMKLAVPLMRARGGGSIINTGSIAGLMGGCGPLAYSAAKAAVIHLSKVAAGELGGRAIRVNTVCPGLIPTSIFGTAMGLPRDAADQMAAHVAEGAATFQPIRRAGAPADIAEAVVFFASDAAAFVTGTSLVVDGGYISGAPDMWGSGFESVLERSLSAAA